MVRALLYLLRTGCRWRDLPCEPVHWRTDYGYFARLHLIDASSVRIPQSAADIRAGLASEAMGKGRGGLTTKIHKLHGRGSAVDLLLSAGNVADIAMAPALIAALRSLLATTLAADKGYDTDKLLDLLVEAGILPCLTLNKTHREKRPLHRGHLPSSSRRKLLLLHETPCILTRYDKLAACLLSMITLAAILDWIR